MKGSKHKSRNTYAVKTSFKRENETKTSLIKQWPSKCITSRPVLKEKSKHSSPGRRKIFSDKNMTIQGETKTIRGCKYNVYSNKCQLNKTIIIMSCRVQIILGKTIHAKIKKNMIEGSKVL